MNAQIQKDDEIIISLPNNITVRQYRLSDAPSLAQNGNNYKIWINLRNHMPHPYTLEASEQWCKHVTTPAMQATSGPIEASTQQTRTSGFAGQTAGTGRAVPTSYVIAVDDKAVGSIGVVFKTDVAFRTAEIGYWLGEEFWGRGMMSLVVPAFVRWTFGTFGVLLRLTTEAYDWNPASAKVLLKAGFRREGVQVDAIVKDGRVGSVMLFGCLRRYIEEEENK